MIYIADAFEKEVEMHEKSKNLTKERLDKIQSLESHLEKDKTTRAQLEDSLGKANEEVRQLKEEKELNNCNCSEVLQKFEELKVLHDKSLEKIAALEEEKSQLTAVMVGMDMEKHSLSKLVKEKEEQLSSFDSTVAKQVAELDALKAEVIALKNVIF